MIVFPEKTLQKKAEKIWKSVKHTVESDVFVCQLDAITNIYISFLLNQGIQRNVS